MNGRFALDTNIIIALIDRDKSIRERIVAADEVFIPSPVIGELYFGAFQSQRSAENVAFIDEVVRSYAIIHIDEITARIYGLMRSKQRQKGTQIPSNDTWVAAVAQQWSATLATRDDHFDVFDGLAIEKW